MLSVEAEADNTLRDLHYSSDDTKAEFNNCFIIHSKYSISSLKTWLNMLTSIDPLKLISSSSIVHV